MIETLSAVDKLLVRYLFHELNHDEATELEDEMLLDDELSERVDVVEMNLIDSYVRDELPAADRTRFEEKFLVDPENRDKVERARMFQESLRLVSDQNEVVRQPLKNRGWLNIFRRPLPAFALVTIAVLLLAALIVFQLRRRVPNANSLVTNSVIPAASPVVATPAPTSVPSNDAGPEFARNDPQRAYVHRQDWNGAERGGPVVQITIRLHVKFLDLVYELGDDKAAARESYGITIKNQYGERVWPQDKDVEVVNPVFGKGGKRKLIVLKVPVKVLSDTGPYSFEIEDQYLPAKQFTVKR